MEYRWTSTEPVDNEKQRRETNPYLIQCKDCYVSVIISPPRVGYDGMVTEDRKSLSI